MGEALYPYYERELTFIRHLAQDFAKRYPAAAGRLLLQPNHSGDPHVERLIESFALLAGRVHHKLDDEFPELTEAMLSVLYPHYLAPIPSMSIVQFVLDAAQGELPNGFPIPRHSRLQTAPVNNLPCRFRTGYPVTLWPLEVTDAQIESPPFPAHYNPPRRTAAALRLQFRCLSQLSLKDLSLNNLRMYLFGEGYVVSALYELIFNNTLEVVFRSLDGSGASYSMLPDKAMRQVGFERDECLLSYPRQSFAGYRLLSEFFAFREKFLFVDLLGWEKARELKFGKKFEVVFFLNQTAKRIEEWVDASNFRLGCTPVVNLFEQVAEPIALTQKKYEYRVVPDVAHQDNMEIYSIDEVISTDPVTATTKVYRPFYSFHHGAAKHEDDTFWYANRRDSMKENDRGTEMYLNLVDLDFQPQLPAESTLVVRTTCTSRDMPTRLQHAGEQLYFELEAAAPLSGIRCLKTPTVTLRPAARRGRYWSLISHLSLNYLSLIDSNEGRDALQEILRLYDFSDPKAGQQQQAEVTRQLIDGIAAVRGRRIVGRAGNETASGFCRGIEVTIEFDEQKYVGTGMFLFASVLENFLGLYASINSFTQLVGKTTQTDGHFRKWPLRAGEQVLL